MNSKKAITILVLATMLLALVPVVPVHAALATDTVLAADADLVYDQEVTITASGTDKLKAERRAVDMAKMKLIDPHTFYTDIGMSDPADRTLKLMLFLQSPAEYTGRPTAPNETRFFHTGP